MSGNTNDFESVEAVLETMNHTLALDDSVIPYINLDPTKLNGFILHFYKHVKEDQVIKECGIRTRAEFKSLITRFVKDVKKVLLQVSHIAPENDELLCVLQKVCDRFRELQGIRWSRKKRGPRNLVVEITPEDYMVGLGGKVRSLNSSQISKVGYDNF